MLRQARDWKQNAVFEVFLMSQDELKHLMEIVRTCCAVLALCLNAIVMAHVMGIW